MTIAPKSKICYYCSIYIIIVALAMVFVFFMYLLIKFVYFLFSPMPWNFRNIRDMFTFVFDGMIYL